MRVKPVLLLLVASLGGGPAFAANDFCEGYKEGYKSGYAQTAGAPPTPMIQVCPVKPPRKPEDRRSDYDIGYARGEKDGMRDGSH